MKKCAVCGVDSGWLIESRKFNMMLCRKHYMKGMRTGNPFQKTKRDPNDIILYSDYAEIILRDNDCNEVARTKVSLDKLDLAKEYKWYRSKSGYAISFIGNKVIHLHKLIVENIGNQVDHINRNKLDNRNENLRPVTNFQNQWNKGKQSNNKSGVSGVYYSKSNKGWVAQITYKKKYHYLGTYEKMEDAIRVRKEAETRIKSQVFGEGY